MLSAKSEFLIKIKEIFQKLNYLKGEEKGLDGERREEEKGKKERGKQFSGYSTDICKSWSCVESVAVSHELSAASHGAGGAQLLEL